MNNLVIMPTEKRTLNLGEYAEYGGSLLPPPKSCGSPVIRSMAVPQPASKCAVYSFSSALMATSTLSSSVFRSKIHCLLVSTTERKSPYCRALLDFFASASLDIHSDNSFHTGASKHALSAGSPSDFCAFAPHSLP